jgi:hypothetical protein
MRTKSLAALMAGVGVLLPGISVGRSCVVQVANGDSHSSISQQFQVALEKRILGSRALSLAKVSERYDIEFYLVRAPANNIARYPTDGRFRAFYVLTDAKRTLLSADLVSCSGDGSDCAGSVVRELADTCRHMPNNSFKPNPLRGSA